MPGKLYCPVKSMVKRPEAAEVGFGDTVGREVEKEEESGRAIAKEDGLCF